MKLWTWSGPLALALMFVFALATPPAWAAPEGAVTQVDVATLDVEGMT